jgi:flagellar hook protein FlgE
MSLMGTAVSGMLANSNWLSNISQNVANANTTGYKDIDTEFATVVDEVGNSSSAAGGVTTTAAAMNTQQGSVVGTTTATDLAVKGDGYFIVSDAAGDIYLTRNGSFTPDSEGNLVNSAGYYLMGYNVQGGSSTTGTSNSLAGLVKVNTISSGEAATPTTDGTLAVNVPSSDATATDPTTPETSLVVYDNLGAAHTIDFTYSYSKTTYDANNNITGYVWNVSVTDATDSADPVTLLTPPATLTFNANGDLTTGSPLTFTVPNGESVNLDVSNTTQLASSFAVNQATANGNAPSSLTGVTISTDGTLDFQYSNGVSSPGYNIPLATVASEDNLTSINGNAFQANQNSGTVRVGTAGTGGLGTVASSSIEDSTVDLATELTNMIQAQSAYQANSKVFQTGADLLDILNNLKS